VKVEGMRHHVALHFAKGTLDIPAGSWDWCGFCGRVGGGCTTILKKGSNAATIIVNSNCPKAPRGKAGAASMENDCRIKFKSAVKWSSAAMASNVPLPCVLCALKQDGEVDVQSSTAQKGGGGGLFVRLYEGKQFVWKFAMAAHINAVHPHEELPTGAADWSALYNVNEELKALKAQRW
jgi:hypothetical protein